MKGLHTFIHSTPMDPFLIFYLRFFLFSAFFHLTSHMTLCFLASTALHHFVNTSHLNKFYFTHKARIKPRCKLWPMNSSHDLWGHIGLPYSLVTPLFPAFTFLFLTLLLVLVIVTFPWLFLFFSFVFYLQIPTTNTLYIHHRFILSFFIFLSCYGTQNSVHDFTLGLLLLLPSTLLFFCCWFFNVCNT